MATVGPAYNGWPLNQLAMTSTGSWSSPNTAINPGWQQQISGIGTQPEFNFQPPEAQAVAIMADGTILVTLPLGSVRIPARLFKDIVTLAELGLLEKLAPAEDSDGR